jgi:hypothetical protein
MGCRRANYIAMRAFGEPDAFPSNDLGLRRVPSGGRTLLSEDEFLNLAQNWLPWRVYAAMCLWAADRAVLQEKDVGSQGSKDPKLRPFQARGQPTAEFDQFQSDECIEVVHELAHNLWRYRSDGHSHLLRTGESREMGCLGVCRSIRASSAVYGLLQGAWPLGLVEGVWSALAIRRWWVPAS